MSTLVLFIDARNAKKKPNRHTPPTLIAHFFLLFDDVALLPSSHARTFTRKGERERESKVPSFNLAMCANAPQGRQIILTKLGCHWSPH